MKRYTLFILISLVALSASAKTGFRTAELGRLAQALALDTEALPEGYSHPVVKGLRLTVHQTAQTVDHIGLCLFSEEMRQMDKSPVFDFLERYLLQLKYPPQAKSMQNMIRDDQFKFQKGSLETVGKLLPTDGFSFTYQATWSRQDSTLLSVSFPVEYELISGENKVEAEDNLPADIRSTEVIIPTGKPAQKNDHYLSEELTNRLYLNKDALLLSSRHPVESAANMMLSLQTAGDFQIKISQLSYGFRKTIFEVPLKQWIAFCQNQGCELYFGLENLSDSSEVEGVVIAVNKAENYNHVLTFRIPSEVIEAESGTIDARLYPYVPTHNVLNMFAAYRKSNPKTFVSK